MGGSCGTYIKGGAYSVLVGRPERNGKFGRPKRRREKSMEYLSCSG
jgi:hypothetical protein